MTLLDAVSKLPDTEVAFVVRKGEQHNEYIEDRLPESVDMIAVENLHAKVVVCDEYAYLGSANITRGGLTVNRELCEIIENEYSDTETYLEAELDLDLSIE